MARQTSEPEFLATCWTTAGNVMPPRTGLLSPIPFEERLRAASDAGFTGIGFMVEDIVAERDASGYRRMAAKLRDFGLEHLELEFLDNWWTDTQPSRLTRARLLEAAGELGARHLKVGAGLLGQIVDPSLLRDRLHGLADEAAAAGTKIALEAAAFSMLPDINSAATLVRDADHPNAGLLLDIWHIHRSGTGYESLANIVPTGSVFAVELDDGLALPSENLYEDTFDNRQLCGHGDFNVVSFIQALNALGYTGPWGVEMMSKHHRTLAPADAARQALEAARDCFNQALTTDQNSRFFASSFE